MPPNEAVNEHRQHHHGQDHIGEIVLPRKGKNRKHDSRDRSGYKQEKAELNQPSTTGKFANYVGGLDVPTMINKSVVPSSFLVYQTRQILLPLV